MSSCQTSRVWAALQYGRAWSLEASCVCRAPVEVGEIRAVYVNASTQSLKPGNRSCNTWIETTTPGRMRAGTRKHLMRRMPCCCCRRLNGQRENQQRLHVINSGCCPNEWGHFPRRRRSGQEIASSIRYLALSQNVSARLMKGERPWN